MKKKCFMNHHLQEGIFFLLVSGGLIAYSLDVHGKSYNKDWTQSPSLFPLVVAVLLGVLALVLLVQGMQGGQQAPGAKGAQPMRVLALLGMMAAYYAALAFVDLPYMGFTLAGMTFALSTFEVATALLLPAMMACLGVRSKAVLILVPVGATAFLSVMFRTLLRVLLP